MKILVTGGAGFIGTNLIKQLLKNNHEVHSLDDYEIGTKENHIEGCNYIEGDITQLDFMDGTEFDLVYHLAALSRIQPSFSNPSETFRVNTLGTQKVAEWCRLFDVKMVYSGSSSKHHDPHQSPYAFSKFMGEEICKHYRKVFGTKIEITRFYNVYGPSEIVDGEWTGDVWKAMFLLMGRKDINVKIIDTDYGCGIIRKSESEFSIVRNENRTNFKKL